MWLLRARVIVGSDTASEFAAEAAAHADCISTARVCIACCMLSLAPAIDVRSSNTCCTVYAIVASGLFAARAGSLLLLQ